MEINYGTDILELTDGTPVSWLSTNFLPTRYKYRCVIHYPNAADIVHQFDYQGISRDGKTLPLRKAVRYSRWDLYTLADGYVDTYFHAFSRPLKPFEYVIERRVDLNTKKVEVIGIFP